MPYPILSALAKIRLPYHASISRKYLKRSIILYFTISKNALIYATKKWNMQSRYSGREKYWLHSFFGNSVSFHQKIIHLQKAFCAKNPQRQVLSSEIWSLMPSKTWQLLHPVQNWSLCKRLRFKWNPCHTASIPKEELHMPKLKTKLFCMTIKWFPILFVVYFGFLLSAVDKSWGRKN